MDNQEQSKRNLLDSETRDTIAFLKTVYALETARDKREHKTAWSARATDILVFLCGQKEYVWRSRVVPSRDLLADIMDADSPPPSGDACQDVEEKARDNEIVSKLAVEWERKSGGREPVSVVLDVPFIDGVLWRAFQLLLESVAPVDEDCAYEDEGDRCYESGAFVLALRAYRKMSPYCVEGFPKITRTLLKLGKDKAAADLFEERRKKPSTGPLPSLQVLQLQYDFAKVLHESGRNRAALEYLCEGFTTLKLFCLHAKLSLEMPRDMTNVCWIRSVLFFEEYLLPCVELLETLPAPEDLQSKRDEAFATARFALFILCREFLPSTPASQEECAILDARSRRRIQELAVLCGMQRRETDAARDKAHQDAVQEDTTRTLIALVRSGKYNHDATVELTEELVADILAARHGSPGKASSRPDIERTQSAETVVAIWKELFVDEGRRRKVVLDRAFVADLLAREWDLSQPPEERKRRLALQEGAFYVSSGEFARALLAYQRFPDDSEAGRLRTIRCLIHTDRAEGKKRYVTELARNSRKGACGLNERAVFHVECARLMAEIGNTREALLRLTTAAHFLEMAYRKEQPKDAHAIVPGGEKDRVHGCNQPGPVLDVLVPVMDGVSRIAPADEYMRAFAARTKESVAAVLATLKKSAAERPEA